MAETKFYPRSPDRGMPPWWAFVITAAAAAAVFGVCRGAVERNADADHVAFVKEENASRRREAATRCVAGRLDQIARVVMPITTPTPHPAPGKAKRPPKRYTPTTVTMDCEDAKRERP